MGDTPAEQQETAPAANTSLGSIADELATLRWRFTAENRTATLKSIAAVVLAVFAHRLGQMDGEQLQTVFNQTIQALGVPTLIPIGVAVFEWWRSER